MLDPAVLEAIEKGPLAHQEFNEALFGGGDSSTDGPITIEESIQEFATRIALMQAEASLRQAAKICDRMAKQAEREAREMSKALHGTEALWELFLVDAYRVCAAPHQQLPQMPEPARAGGALAAERGNSCTPSAVAPDHDKAQHIAKQLLEGTTHVVLAYAYLALRAELDAALGFYEGVKGCTGDTWECKRCGHSEPWWTDSNADYATRAHAAAIERVNR
jgi:hypothetical protein